jgi:hypothetical protein
VSNFSFSADENFKAKFEPLAEVLGVENHLKNMAEVFERAMDISLEKNDPKKKLERRLEKERNRKVSKDKTSPRSGNLAVQDVEFNRLGCAGFVWEVVATQGPRWNI